MCKLYYNLCYLCNNKIKNIKKNKAKMKERKIKITMQPNLRATMQGMQVGDWFTISIAHENTIQNYASMFKLGAMPFLIKKDGKILTVIRIEK